ncbi:hypothetical protein [Candidatus Pyrohabitans sp.]
MHNAEVEARLSAIEKEFNEAEFWRLVSRVKRSRALAEKYAERIAHIDAGLFRKRARVRVSIAAGSLVMLLLAAFAVFIILLAPSLEARLHGLLMLFATFLLMTALHPLAHLIAGRALGIRFLFYFPDGPAKIEPTLKVDYASYLRVSPQARAAMHFSGIAASILATAIGFLAAYLTQAPRFAILSLAALLFINTILEFSPPLLVRLGFRGFRKSDAYRAFRELKQREE